VPRTLDGLWLSPAGGRSCNPKIIGEFRVRFEAETNKELTFSPSFQIDTIDIDRDEELGGYLTSRRRDPRSNCSGRGINNQEGEFQLKYKAK